MGSSRIIAIVSTVTGGIGPTGPTGPTGNTGSYIEGSRGNRGVGVHTLTYDYNTNGITFTLTDETKIYLTGIRGSTGVGATAAPYGVNISGTGTPIITNISGSSGYTLSFRSLLFSNGITASIVGDSIHVRDNLSYTGPFDVNGLLFVDYSSVSNTYFLDSSNSVYYYESSYSGYTYGKLVVASMNSRDLLDGYNINYSSGNTQGVDHVGLTMTIDAAFYGMTGTHISITADSWKPYLKFRASYYDSDGSAGATVGLINFSPLGPYTKKITFDTPIGSCCFECIDECSHAVLGDRSCVDYVSKTYCDSILGRWSSLTCYDRRSTYDCFPRRACCIGNRCFNTTGLKCLEIGGTFCDLKTCGDISYNCGQPCSLEIIAFPVSSGVGEQQTCCCVNGLSYVLTDAECQSRGGVFVGVPPCDNYDCCVLENPVGACCLPNGSCQMLSPQECSIASGIYRGTGITCGGVQC